MGYLIFRVEFLGAWGIFGLVWMGCIVCYIGCLMLYIGYREYIVVVCLFAGVYGEKARYQIQMKKAFM